MIIMSDYTSLALKRLKTRRWMRWLIYKKWKNFRSVLSSLSLWQNKTLGLQEEGVWMSSMAINWNWLSISKKLRVRKWNNKNKNKRKFRMLWKTLLPKQQSTTTRSKGLSTLREVRARRRLIMLIWAFIHRLIKSQWSCRGVEVLERFCTKMLLIELRSWKIRESLAMWGRVRPIWIQSLKSSWSRSFIER